MIPEIPVTLKRNKGGRPPAPIDRKQVVHLAFVGMSNREIGMLLNVHHRTVADRFPAELQAARALRENWLVLNARLGEWKDPVQWITQMLNRY